ncbi:MAG: PAS domain S-box protein [Acidimicrobiales bacterium]
MTKESLSISLEGSREEPLDLRPLSDLSEQRLWRMLEVAPDAMIMADDDGTILVVNRQVEAMFGYDRCDLLGRMVEMLLPERFHVAHVANRDDFRAEPTARSMGSGLDLWAKRSDGSEFPVEVGLSPLVDDQGSAVVVSIRDITDQIKSEHQLRASEAAFRTTFNEAPVGMLTARLGSNGSCIIESVNRAFCEMLDKSSELLIGADIDDFTHPDDITGNQDAEIDSPRFTEEKRYRRSDGTYVWSLLHSSTLHSGETPLVLAHVLDISDRRASEIERERQRRWLAGLSEIRTHLLEGRPIDEALTLACRHACAIGNAQTAMIGTEDRSSRHLDRRATYSRLDQESGTARQPITSAIRSAIDSQQTVAVENNRPTVQGDPANFGSKEQFGAGPCLISPLVTGSEISGVLLLGRDLGEEPFTEAEVQIVESFAHQAATAVEFARLRIDRERLGLLEDRERIARDLHDLVIQRLFAAGMGLQSTASLVPSPATERIRSTIGEIDVAITELRSAIFSLSNPDQPKSVAAQVAEVIRAHHPRLGFEPTLSIDDAIETVPSAVIEQLLPTLNEALSNIERHANAGAVEISVEVDEAGLTLSVCDDGDGLPSHELTGNGLRNLDRRAQRLGGASKITNNRHAGATLTWRVKVARS